MPREVVEGVKACPWSDANLSLFPVPGECTIFAAVRDLMVNLTLPPGGRP